MHLGQRIATSTSANSRPGQEMRLEASRPHRVWSREVRAWASGPGVAAMRRGPIPCPGRRERATVLVSETTPYIVPMLSVSGGVPRPDVPWGVIPGRCATRNDGVPRVGADRTVQRATRRRTEKPVALRVKSPAELQEPTLDSWPIAARQRHEPMAPVARIILVAVGRTRH